MFGRKDKKKTRGEDSEFAANLGMLGRAPGLDDDDDEDLEAELAALMGGGQPQSRAKPRKAPVDMSVIDRMAAESMRDVSEDEDVDENDPELLAELQALEPGEDTPKPQPSPQPPRAGQPSGLQALLEERKQMYEAAKASALAKGDGSKARRYDRGLKTIEGQLKAARAGKPVAEDEIPPPVAVGGAKVSQPEPAQPPPAQPTVPPMQPTAAPMQPTAAPLQPTTAPLKPTAAPIQPTTAPVQPQVAEATPQEPVPMETDSEDKKKLAVIRTRRDQYKLAAQTAKKAGDKQAMVKYFKTSKQFDAVISAIESGQPVDLANMPPPPPSPQEVLAQASKQPSSMQQASAPLAAAPPSTQEAPAASTGVPPPPKSVLEALQQRMDKYKSASDQAKAEGNGSKARRMGRITKQYQDAIKNHKLGKPVDFNELPCPPGYPPIPGMRAAQDDGAPDVPGISVVPPSQPAQSAAQPSGAAGQRSRSKSPQPPGRSRSKSPQPAPKQPVKKSPSGVKSRAQQQLEFLEERQKQFKMAALKAKNEGDMEHAKTLLRQAKGFDPMIEAAQGGLPVDLTKIPSLPSEPLDVDEFLESAEEADPAKIGDSEEMYARLAHTLKKQIETCKTSSEQYTHLGDLQEATKLERMGQASRQDLDTVKNAHNHGDPPPRFHYETRTFRLVKINTELLDSDLEVSVLRGVAYPLPSGISEPKDLYTYVKFELPYPHDKPQESSTSTFKGDANPEYKHTEKFRIDRKARSWLGTVKRKAIKFEVFYERGFLRSDKSMGEAQLKLENLENKAEVHEIIDLKDGRKTCGGKLEVKVRQREPLTGKQVQHVQEKWLVIDSVKRRQDGAGTSPQSSSQGSPNLPSLEVLKFEQKLLERQIQAVKSKGRLVPERSIQVYQEMGQQIIHVQNQLATGGPSVKKAYIRQLEASLASYHAEAVQWNKQGKKDRAHQALSKKKVVENELMKFKAAAVHTK
ncbi:coiled-coil and C2 domain-containing protein 1-like isoform X5 [Branchiostoma floridae]|uniref:Coiled-coil and C2 domain-containing protein 1-like isoform X5 n=1 Tax=Branchiostoma floridae TaxID=7739 RepID=A0A9J7MH43_BRAFL|nr:coiled-coil and C2 domain-containing protein 1-like isoform X5 [Branchiostoma floridae]